MSEEQAPQKKPNFIVDTKLPLLTDDISKIRYPEIFYIPDARHSTYIALDLKDNALSSMDKTTEGRQWKASVMNGARMTTHGDRFVSSLERDDAMWSQDIPFGDASVRSRSVQAMSDNKSTAAYLRIRQKMRLGIPHDAVLPHTGGWARIDAATDDEIVELERAIKAEKVDLGRQTFGAIFSSLRGYTSRTLLNFIQSKIIASSIDCDINSIYDHIDILDIDALVIGFAQATWPNGFEYSRACISKPGECIHVTKGKVMPIRMQFTDINSLTERQKAILARKAERSVSLDDLKTYKNEFIRGKASFVNMGYEDDDDSFQAKLKTCTITQYIDSTYRWVGSLEDRYTDTILKDPEVRNEYLYTQARASSMRMYAHFIEAGYEDGNQTITGIEDIEQMLSDLSRMDNIKDRFIKAVGKYIDDTTISVIAVPEYYCPACGEEQKADQNTQRFKGLIPIDASKAFFAIMVQTAARIKQRQL